MKSQVSHTGRQAKQSNRKMLVVANEIIEGQTTRQAIGPQVGDEQRAEVRVVAPGTTSPAVRAVRSMRWRLRSAPRLITPGRLFVFARHAESEANIANALSSDPARPVALTEYGRQQARELGAQLTNLGVDLAVATRFLRTQQTIEIALRGRQVPILIEPGFDEVDAGEFDGAPIDTYWSWKDGHASHETFPAGESEDDALRRYADALQRLLERTEPVTLVVTHEHALRSIATAATHDPSSIGPDTALVNAVPYSFDERALRRARTGLLARVPPTVRPQVEPRGVSGLAA
jgi:broad specificity phosphatase PhoE